MKLPRDLSGREVVAALVRRLEYRVVHERGSHSSGNLERHFQGRCLTQTRREGRDRFSVFRRPFVNAHRQHLLRVIPLDQEELAAVGVFLLAGVARRSSVTRVSPGAKK